MTPELVIISHIVNETIKFSDRTVEGVLGSPTAYASVVAGRLGMRTGVVTKIGTDLPPNFLKAFEEANVDTRGIKVEGRNTTHSLLIYDELENKIILYPKKAPPLLFEDIPQEYLGAKIVYICPMDHDVPLKTIKALYKQGISLAADIGGYGGAHSTKHPSEKEKKTRKTIKEVIKHFHIVKASSEDSRHLFGAKEDMEEEMAELIVNLGADISIVTLGEKGSLVSSKKGTFTMPAFPSEVKDCTGAGDVYMAGFLVEYLRTKDVWKSALFASATASIVIEGTGGVVASRMPTTSEVEKRISKVSLKDYEKAKYPLATKKG
ncbi:ATP-dependent 6-phosphofructokinase [subsurface metagenome]